MYWEAQKDIDMDDKDDAHPDEYVFMVHMVPINGTSMQQMQDVLVKVNLDEKI